MTIQHMTSDPLVLEAIAPGTLMSLNHRTFWAVHAAAVKNWRYWAGIVGRSYNTPALNKRGPSIVTVELPVPDKRRRDPHNYIATVKPIIDGLVDAGLWPDDTPEWVTVAEPRLIVRRDHLVRILIDPRPTPATKEPNPS